ncbi:beta-defensin 17-like [Petaurus breviceps papuanus]|uniref:beta-defensin 17-like n=1 Tax=Petaurus breviceps papuanus TaxID=3040969 RepID=UPI0036DE694C
MKIFFFIFFLLFYGISILPARSGGGGILIFGDNDYSKKCRLIKGTCKQLCSEYETRVSYCIRPSTVCCI